ncbi:TetR/AcrR family transcriptional regulator C-terminal ligand-binding domain-containing protein [Streptomyces griseofuscus]|uniref:TetR/AcrR family transcriptional regulator C-terminal ligand-binding domain-containing protein n=1 Tax=Streptomyces griseofuscus TaxID=146922 RepID=UPI0033D09054
MEAYAIRTLVDLTRPGSIAFFRAEVSPDIDERRSGLRACLQRATAGLDTILEASRGRGETPPPLKRLLDQIVAPLYFHVVFSVLDTDETYARALVANLFSGTWHSAGQTQLSPAKSADTGEQGGGEGREPPSGESAGGVRGTPCRRCPGCAASSGVLRDDYAVIALLRWEGWAGRAAG